ncbi:hypothetical protein [Taibaiella koreensis]|uniref:hypothetical protein n=1 Tax=Taibaiella koreensis TaxID=1268548 RepID=UPI000E59D4CD|nr:hypothetical protein [Taibaiella koreensis]
MPIIFEQITALFRGDEAVGQLKPGSAYMLRITYFRATGKVQIAIIGQDHFLLYPSWSALMEDWALSGTLY